MKIIMYTGTIVEESLLDNRILNEFKIIAIRISNAEKPEDRWHLYEVEVTIDQMQIIAAQLKPEGWYAHFWQDDTIIVVFPNREFTMKLSDKTTWSDAIKYGKSIGIPTNQLDFKIKEI